MLITALGEKEDKKRKPLHFLQSSSVLINDFLTVRTSFLIGYKFPRIHKNLTILMSNLLNSK